MVILDVVRANSTGVIQSSSASAHSLLTVRFGLDEMLVELMLNSLLQGREFSRTLTTA